MSLVSLDRHLGSKCFFFLFYRPSEAADASAVMWSDGRELSEFSTPDSGYPATSVGRSIP